MTVHKLTPEELDLFKKSREKMMGKRAVPREVTVDDKMRKNLQSMIPVDLWMDIRVRAASIGLTVSDVVTQGMTTYLMMDDEDLEAIKARHL